MKKGIDYIGVTASYLAHDGKGNYVMTKRGDNCRDEQGCWDFGGGGVDMGDSVEETIIKEVKEELCADIIEMEFLGYRDLFREMSGEKTHWVSFQFLVRVSPEQVKNGEPHKFDDVQWFTLDNLPSPLHSTALPMLEKFDDKLPK
jgi:8-oxo-dGTP pyrophosphatase MutT (NUDIX family)